MILVRPLIRPLAVCLVTLASALPALAVDLSVTSIEVTQGLQTSTNSLALVARNATIVRVRVSLNGQATAQPGVDAVLRVFAGGVELPTSPVYSLNGPISAPASPNPATIDHTINFLCVPPQSTDVDFVVTLNPFRTVVETNYANNQGSVTNKPFLCRKFVDLAYMPINYVPGGGQPSATLIEPGTGDSFVRGIYKTGDWNYHRSPLPVLTWTQNIETSNTTLLNTINDLRQNQIPAAGFARPEFIYAWLPGNPFSGNGQAIGIPGAAAFGNSETSRFQRTFAHELGHLWGLQHNTNSIGTVGFDAEHLLRDPLNLAQVMATTKKDVMYAGLVTADAWVALGTYNDPITDARTACTADGSLAGDDADPGIDILRVAGSHDHVAGTLELWPVTEQERLEPTPDDPSGNLVVRGLSADGTVLHAVRVSTRGCAESCGDPTHHHRQTSLWANLPRIVDGMRIDRITVHELAPRGASRLLAQRIRSATAPEAVGIVVRPDAISAVPFDPDSDRLDGRIRIDWSATDADGDALSADILYSPDGGMAWLPVAVGDTSGSVSFDARDLPASRGRSGRFRVDVGDGMNASSSSTQDWFLLGNSAPPDVHVIGPNGDSSFRQGATVFLHGSAWDIDDQLLPESSISWSSSIDGSLGFGRQVVRRDLTPGIHVITLRGTDSGGLFTERTINLTITPRAFNSGDLDGNGSIDGSDLALLLIEWGSNGIADLTLDGTVDGADLALLLIRWS